MQDLKKQEMFELEVLDSLNSGKLLNKLVFCGGTMLRLCYGLDRYSVDLDFWLSKNADYSKLYTQLRKLLSQNYKIVDSANKFYTILFELKADKYTRSLKLEIRKETQKFKIETGIAYSKHSNIQVLVKHVSLADMMKSKVRAFLSRKEIRDVYDLEFLFKRGIPLKEDIEILKALVKGIYNLTKHDYSVKLGSLLEIDKRKYYKEKNFTVLLMSIKEMLASEWSV